MHFAAQSPFMMKNVKRFCFQYCPEKVVQLLGYDMPYFDLNFSKDALGLLCDEDRMEVEHAIYVRKVQAYRNQSLLSGQRENKLFKVV